MGVILVLDIDPTQSGLRTFGRNKIQACLRPIDAGWFRFVSRVFQ